MDLVNDFEIKNDKYDYEHNQVVFTFNKNYFLQTINLIETISLHNDVSYVFVCDYIDEELSKYVINSNHGIRLIVLRLKGHYNTKRWPTITLFRVYLPWVLKDINKIVYLDSDMICLGNFDELFQLDCRIAMVPEMSGTIQRWLNNNYGINNYLYYNAGVCLMNLSVIRDTVDINDIDKEFVEKIDKYILNDQDFINVYFNDIFPLDIKYNNQIYEFRGSYYFDYIMRNSVFLHFSYLKPWADKVDLYYAKIYLKYSVNKKMIAMVKKVIKKNRCWFLKCRVKKMLIRNNG